MDTGCAGGDISSFHPLVTTPEIGYDTTRFTDNDGSCRHVPG